jgi:SAM-dependent methyltransferase
VQHIAILVHENDQFKAMKSRYFLDVIAEIWRDEGFRVSLLYGPGRYVEADLIILHVNLTVIPDDYMEFMRLYPRALNASVNNISKRSISAHQVSLRDKYAGAVIVKTDQNCRGAPEARLKVRKSRRERILARFFGDMAAGKLKNYPIYDSIRKVPLRVWLNRGLIVEKFIPEMHDGHYCLRTWTFLGDRETSSICYSKDPIIKSKNVIRREVLNDVPDELRQIRRELGFDFGKFDYAIVDGKMILYDVNRTPTLGGFSTEQLMTGMRMLADGIHSFFAGEPDRGSHWSRVAQVWRQIGKPLRPSEQDTAFLEAEIALWAGAHGAPRVLILGVTPELYHLPWPQGTKLIAVDRTQNMITAIWPGSASDAICSDWQRMSLEDSSRDIVLCDGGIHLMSYPEEQRAFVQTLQRVVSPGGLCLFRLFVPPEKQERTEDVLEDMLTGKIRDLNILKLRLGMSLLEDVNEGVALKEVWDALHRAAPDFEKLAEKISWPLEHLLAINTYRDSPNKYYFLGLEEVLRLFCKEPGGFRLERIHRPDYELGERCPTILLRKLITGGTS